MKRDIENLPEAEFQRLLERHGAAGVRLAAFGVAVASLGVLLMKVGMRLPMPVLAPFYVMAVVGAVCCVVGGASWLLQRRRSRNEPPLPVARLR